MCGANAMTAACAAFASGAMESAHRHGACRFERSMRIRSLHRAMCVRDDVISMSNVIFDTFARRHFALS